VSSQRLAEARAASLDDTDLVEIAAVVATMTFSNYVNIMADTEIDLPLAPNLPRIDS
jgi:alkylhydroperoxidase family enzyme